MVRQKPRKTVEELYAAAPPQGSLATSRFDENLFQNSKNNKSNKVSEKSDLGNCRKKSKGPEKKDEKTFINEERLLRKSAKSKKSDPFASPSLDNKNFISFVDENEKDEDTEEFFELIKETVESAVGKTLSDILNRNFKEVTAKIDDLKEQMCANQTKLEKIQADMMNKIVHYGEENSRHFRYLCMKSEYDKMFYQHQNIMTAIPVDSRPNVLNPFPQQFASPGQRPSMAQQSSHLGQQSQQQQQQQQQVPLQQQPLTGHSNYASSRQKTSTGPVPSQCNCHSTGCGDFVGGDRSKTSMSTKSSEMGVKEVKELLEQLQKFYENQQNQDKDSRKDVRGDISLNIEDDSGDGDGDEDDSSDDLSSPSIEEKLGAAGDS